MTRLVTSLKLFVCAAALLSSHSATAQPEATITFGIKGGANFSMLSEPSEDIQSDGVRIDLPVPGFTGTGGGFTALAVEALYANAVGLEIDLIFASTEGKGDLNFLGGASIEERITTSEIQIPILLKAQLPTGSIHPFIGLGITLVNQTDAEFTIDTPQLIDTTIEPESYSMLTVALGVNIEAGPLNVPIELRGLYQSLDDDPRRRASFETSGSTLTSLGVRAVWEGQIWFTVGVGYRLEL
jgi:hypothetical protein